MQCVLLAAGEGTRMRPLTASRPKVMLPIANRPMMEYLICAARESGIVDFVLVVGYREQEIRTHFGDGSDFGIRISYVTQRRQMGTADALNSTKELIQDRFLLLNGDMLLHTDDIRAMCNITAPGIGIYPSDHPEDFGVVNVEGSTVTGLVEKSRHPPTNLINAGAYLFNPDIFDILPTLPLSERGEYELTDALAVYIREETLRAYRLNYWCDVGAPWDLLGANETMMATMADARGGMIEEGVTIHGPLALGEGSVIKSGTYIEGPCVIGKNCRIGPHTYIRGATAIGDGCHIGHSTEIKNSIVLSGTNLPHFNYLGDSVVGSGCNFGAGTKVANLRHDRANVRVAGKDTGRKKFGAIIGDNVQLGINCSVNVGAIVGSGVKVAPHQLVEGYIGDETVLQ
jgi:UDP-N-acetylglucosamine diphosphorylase/glucosamine-1-phosphate N-acetyltransferase